MSKEVKPNPGLSDEELRKYLSTRDVMVVCSSLASARSIRKLMAELGAKSDLVFTSDRFKEAKNQMESKPTQILIADYFLGEQTGLELMEAQKKPFNSLVDISCIVVCQNPDEVTLGTIVDSNVDGMLNVPYTIGSFKSVIHQALQNKVRPSNYWQTLNKGRELLFQKDYESAVQAFESAKTMDNAPILAHYYIGLIAGELGDWESAVASFEEGLKIDAKDYRCLTALLDLWLRYDEHELAYEVATQLHEHHAVSTSRILDLVKLSVYNKKFTDILDYYQIFKQLKKRDNILNRVVIASLLVCSRYFKIKSEKIKNLEVLKDAGKLANESGILQMEVFRYLIESKHYDDADKYYRELPEALREQLDMKMLALELAFASGQDSIVIQEGMAMLKAKQKCARIYELMIDSSIRLNRSSDRVEELINEARMYYPDFFKKTN